MNILIIRTGGLGDCLLTLPVAVALRDRHPAARMAVLGNGIMLAAARLSGLFDEYRSIESGSFHTLFGGASLAPDAASFVGGFDSVYCFSSAPESMLRDRILSSGANAVNILDPVEPAGFDRHITAHYAGILGNDGAREDDLRFPKLVPDVQSLPDTAVVIHPGSGGLLKNWPLERFIAAARLCRGTVRFILGPAEMERGFSSRLENAGFPVAAPATLEELRDELLRGVAYLGNDSGVSHLAAVLGIPSTVLFGPTDPRVWRPRGPHVGIVRSPDDSMESLGVETVSAVVRKMTVGKAASK